MYVFPVIAVAIALIAIGRGAGLQYFEERPRDRIARRVCLVLGIVIMLLYAATWIL